MKIMKLLFRASKGVIMGNEIELPPEFGKDESNQRIACIFNADVKEFIAKLEKYDGSYIDKRFWNSIFWKQLKSTFM